MFLKTTSFTSLPSLPEGNLHFQGHQDNPPHFTGEKHDLP